MIYITSFKQSIHLPSDVERHSAAVYQPQGFAYPKAQWCDIRPDGKNWIRPREFVGEPEPLKAYWEALWRVYLSREDAILKWAEAHRHHDVALCCWCPYDRAAQRQMKEWGSFVCHTAVVGEFLTELGEDVWYDGDRRRMTILSQKGL